MFRSGVCNVDGSVHNVDVVAHTLTCALCEESYADIYELNWHIRSHFDAPVRELHVSKGSRSEVVLFQDYKNDGACTALK